MNMIMTNNEEVLGFIEQFINHHDKSTEEKEIIRKQFMDGYCLAFAYILKETFERGEVCWAAPYGHMVWCDEDGTPYDIEGVYQGEAEHFIPIKYLRESILDFKHIPGKYFDASEEYIQSIIEEYLHGQK